MKISSITLFFLLLNCVAVAQEKVDEVKKTIYGDEAHAMFKRIGTSFENIGSTWDKAHSQLDDTQTGQYNARITLRGVYTELGETKNNISYLLELYDRAENYAESGNCSQTTTQLMSARSHLRAAYDYVGFGMQHLGLFINQGHSSGMTSYVTQSNAFLREWGKFTEYVVTGFAACEVQTKPSTKQSEVPTPIVVEISEQTQTKETTENKPTDTKPVATDKSKIDLGIYFGTGKDSDIYEAFFIYKGSKAEQAGIERFDYLLKINGIALNTKTQDQVKAMLNPPVGSTITIS